MPWTLYVACRWDCVSSTLTSVLLTRGALTHAAPLQHVLARPLGRGEQKIRNSNVPGQKKARVVCQRKTGTDAALLPMQRLPHQVRCSHHLALANAFARHVYHTFLKFELHGGPLLRVTSRSAVNIALRDIEHPLEFRCRRVSSGGLIIGKTGETNLTCRSTYRLIVNCKPLSIPAILCR